MANHAEIKMACGDELSAQGNQSSRIRDRLVERLVSQCNEITRAVAAQSQAATAEDQDEWECWQQVLDKANFELLVTRLALFQFDQQGGQQ